MFESQAQTTPQGDRIVVKKLVMIETGTYNQMYRRPYYTQPQQGVMDMLEERAAGAPHFSSALLSDVSNRIVQPMAQPEAPIYIPHGFSERRMRFMMEIEFVTPIGTIGQLLTGWTDNIEGVTAQGHINPNLEFTINSTVHTRPQTLLTPQGNRVVRSVFDTSQVLANNDFQGIHQNQVETRMRPHDMFSIISRTHLPQDGSVFDTRTMNGPQPVKSQRANNVASAYTANLFEGYRNAAIKQTYYGDDQDVINNARDATAEKLATRDPFMSAVAGLRATTVSNKFLWGDLVTLDPNADRVKQVFFLDDARRAAEPQAGATGETWEKGYRLQQVATILGQAIPALMAETLIGKVGFIANNMNYGVNAFGQPPVTVDVMMMKGFSPDMDLSQPGLLFEQRLQHEILKDISYDNMVKFWIKVTADLLGTTRLEISLEGEPAVPFDVPTFCDALFVPVLTQDSAIATHNAEDFEGLFEHLKYKLETNGGGNQGGGNLVGSF